MNKIGQVEWGSQAILKYRSRVIKDDPLPTGAIIKFVNFSCEWHNLPRPPPPTQYYLGYAYACSLPLKAPPYLRTDKISEPPFRGLFAGFSCLGDPPKSRTLLNVPPIFHFIIPFFYFSGVQRERERKTTPIWKKSPGEKSNTPLFYNSRAGLCRTKSTPLPEILGTRMLSLRPRSGGGGGGRVISPSEIKINCSLN